MTKLEELKVASDAAYVVYDATCEAAYVARDARDAAREAAYDAANVASAACDAAYDAARAAQHDYEAELNKTKEQTNEL